MNVLCVIPARYASTRLPGKPLKDLRLKENSLIGCIVRNRKSIIPNGDTEIQLGDSVILVTTDSRFNDLKDAFDI